MCPVERQGSGTQRLHAVAVSEDGTELMLARRVTAKTGTYRLAIDQDLVDRLLEASAVVQPEGSPASSSPAAPAADADPLPEPFIDISKAESSGRAPGAKPIRPASKLTPKQIQALLRQGKPVDQIAKKAGVDPAWVERFEAPIIWERAGVLERAKKVRLLRSRRGLSTLALGDAVERNVLERSPGLDAETIDSSYSAIRHPKSGSWIIRFSYESRGRKQNAEWTLDPETNQVFALNKLAADLGWTEARRGSKS